MDDLFLYNYIKQAIKQRKHHQKNTESDNFAENYCRRELMKKKINFNPSTHQSASIKKMKILMKDFRQVETYIDLNELLYNINSIKAKQQLQKKFNNKSHRIKDENSKIQKSNNLNSSETHNSPSHNDNKQQQKTTLSDPIQALKDKFKGEINQMMNRKYQIENAQIDSLISHLQKQTNFSNSLLRNSSTNYLSYLDNSLQKIVRQDDPSGRSYQQDQQIFKYLTQTLSRSLQPKTPNQYYKSTNLNSKQKNQENQLLHKISSFLQIALENQHKQKWASKQIKKFRSTHGSFRLNNDNFESDKFFIQDIQISKENKEIFLSQNIQRKRAKSKRTIIKKNTVFLTRKNSLKKTVIPTFSLQHSETNLDEKNQKQKNFDSSDDGRRNKDYKDLFKRFQNGSKIQRKTVPARNQNINSSFHKKENGVPSYDSLEYVQPKKVNFQTTNAEFLQSKRDYLLKRVRKQKDMDFACLKRNNIHSKTVIIRPHQSANETLGLLDGNQSESILFAHGPNFLRESNPMFSLSRNKIAKKTIIASNFTFKKRSKKQIILNKLNSFIQGVTNQQKISKQQNQYYDSAINHLQDLSKTAFKSYEPEALAGNEEILELKKFVNSINPSLRKNHTKKQIGKRSVE